MNKTEFIDKLLHLGSTIEIRNSTHTSKKAKELAHTLLDDYLESINYTHCCESDSEKLLFTQEEIVERINEQTVLDGETFRNYFDKK